MTKVTTLDLDIISRAIVVSSKLSMINHGKAKIKLKQDKMHEKSYLRI